jgi:hypothetical protein
MHVGGALVFLYDCMKRTVWNRVLRRIGGS